MYLINYFCDVITIVKTYELVSNNFHKSYNTWVNISRLNVTDSADQQRYLGVWERPADRNAEHER